MTNRRRFLAVVIPAVLAGQSRVPAGTELKAATGAVKANALQMLKGSQEVAGQVQMAEEEGIVVDTAAAQVLTGAAGTVTIIPLRGRVVDEAHRQGW